MDLVAVDDVIQFWFEVLSPKDWYRAPGHVDAEIRSRFGGLYEAFEDHVPQDWLASPRGLLAGIVVLDQFPRNMFRGRPQAFATDAKALVLSKEALSTRADMALPPKQRAFIYLPFQHAEDLDDQARSVGLFTALGNPLNLDYAIRHQEIIERFGCFPHRNATLGRHSTEEEKAFLKEPGSSF